MSYSTKPSPILKKILIVDSDPNNALILKRTLQVLECETHIASDGWDAIELAKEHIYSLILLEIDMPLINGFETISRIQRMTLNIETPIFFLTNSDTDHRILLKAYKVGAVDFITKPINISVLRRKAQYFLDFYEKKESLKIAKIQAEQLMKSRMNLVANITHEIRSPLFAMIGMIEALDEEREGQDSKDLIKKLYTNSQHLLETVNGFLDFSKVELSESRVEFEYFSLRKMCEDLIDVLSYQHHLKESVSLYLKFDDSLPDYIRADKQKLRQILINLISNAIKFTDQGQVAVHVENLGLDGINSIMKFTIKDNGIGIPEDKLASIFSEYAQVESEKQNNVIGTGLGLSICKKLVDVLGGQLEVQSIEGKGSEFSFSIPYYEGEGEDAPEEGRALNLNDHIYKDELKVLIVDDVQDNIFVIKNYLKCEKVKVDYTVNPLEGVHKMMHNFYDLVLLDINMPDKDGFQVCEEVRDFEAKRNATEHIGRDQFIVALTAFNLDANLENRLSQSGFNNFLMKPVRKDLLYKIISKAQKDEGEGRMEARRISENENSPDHDFASLDEDFMEYLPTYVDNKIHETTLLVNGAKSNDVNEVCAYCHKILGTAKSFGFHRLDEEVKLIQSMAKKDFRENYDEILKLSEGLLDYLNNLKASL